MEKEQLEKMYWEQGLTIQEIADELECPYQKTYRLFRKKYGIDTHKSLWQRLQVEDSELRICLNNKYANMKARISGRHDPYGTCRGKELLSEQEFVELCNKRLRRIVKLWRQYLESGKRLKYAVSIDRSDNEGGYTKENLQFVIYGFNSWKDELNPVSVKKQGDEARYFSSPQEASRFYGCRPDDLREVLRGEKYNRQKVEIEQISEQELLNQHECQTIREYYHEYLI